MAVNPNSKLKRQHPQLADYTVVGLYTDNKQVCVHHVSATSIENAVDKARILMDRNSSAGGAVLSVFAGTHTDWYGEDELYEE